MGGHVLEPAVSGRARCRGCGQKIARAELRFGERLPNPIADEGDTTLWFHPGCGACKRPEPFLEALEAWDATGPHEAPFPERGALETAARRGVELRRLPRIDGAERAPSGRALCRECRVRIERGGWRVRLVFFEDARFVPGGFVHAGCAADYFGTGELFERVARFTPSAADRDDPGLAELRTLLGGGAAE